MTQPAQFREGRVALFYLDDADGRRIAQIAVQLAPTGESLTPEQRRLVATCRQRIRERQPQVEQWLRAESNDNVDHGKRLLAQRLERAAWAELNRDPLADTLVPWTRRQTREDAGHPAARVALEEIQDELEPPADKDGARSSAALRERVRNHAAEALGP